MSNRLSILDMSLRSILRLDNNMLNNLIDLEYRDNIYRIHALSEELWRLTLPVAPAVPVYHGGKKKRKSKTKMKRKNKTKKKRKKKYNKGKHKF